MTTNADITIFNKRYVREERTEKFCGNADTGRQFLFQERHIIREPGQEC